MQNYKSVKQPENFPDNFIAVVEIPMNSGAAKYEISDEGFLCVDRFMPVSMQYPCNYGFIPNTLGGDGDPLDVLVISREPIVQGALINARPVGVLFMEDEKGKDEKILAVPAQKVDLFYKDIDDVESVPKFTLDQIKHFFEYYKKLEAGKFTKIISWGNADDAKKIVSQSGGK